MTRASLVLALATLLAAVGSTQAQRSPFDRLPLLPGDYCSVRYSPGSLDRAAHVLKRVEVVGGYLNKQGKTTIPFLVVVASRQDWREAAVPVTYALPARIGRSTIAVPAAGDEITVERWRNWLGTDLPQMEGYPLDGTPQQAASLLLADILLQKQLGELFVENVLVGVAAQNVHGVVAHLVALLAYDTFEPTRLTQVRTVYQRLRDNLPVLRQAMGERAGPEEAWLQEQGEEFFRAWPIFEAYGKKSLKRILKHALQGNQVTEAALVELFPDAFAAAAPSA